MFARPFAWDDLRLELSHPVASFSLSLGRGAPATLEAGPESCIVQRSQAIWLSWDDWCEDLVRRLYVRRGYLWDVRVAEPDSPAIPCSLAAATGWEERVP
jgi:hypothetical protein